jgi:cell division protein ZapA (FtsZ GTPase activity inhibitor)
MAAAVWLVSNTRPVAPPSSLTVICGLNVTDELAELGAFTDTEAGGKAAGVEAS